jgi:hypothetical protein
MVNITPIDPNSLALQTFNVEDFIIIPNQTTSSEFVPVRDRIEYFIYDYNDSLLHTDYNLTSYTPARINTAGNILEINLDPEKDALDAGYDTGIVKTIYNFITPELGTEISRVYISQISPSRTEIRLSSNSNPLFEVNLEEGETFLSSSNYLEYSAFRDKYTTSAYFDEFYLNFEDNIYILGINSLFEYDEQTQTTSLLIKLYEPLPTNIGLKTECYIVTKLAESVGYQLSYTQEFNFEDTSIKLAPANYNIPILNEIGPTTIYKNYDDITTTTLSGSFFQLINNISSSSPNINVDYTDYEDFVFFSSAYQRLTNFRDKVTSISQSQYELDLLYSSISGPTANSTVVSSSKVLIEAQIAETIASFDGYENYLYYDSGSKSWPKSNSVIPYDLYSPTSVQATTWFNNQIATASAYDNQNQNNLEFAVPSFIRYNNSNMNYILFTNMIGQFFDEIWLYTKAITAKLEAESNLYQGVSKDLVGQVLQSLGTKIYDSSFTLENIYSSIIGLSATGATSPSTGSQYITNYVTSSIATSQVPTIDDFVKLSYKKIYANLPYLLKKKGTVAGLRALINIFGVPDTILRISEFGGKDKKGETWDKWQHQFNYCWTTQDSGYIETDWGLNTNWGSQDNVPNTIEFKFKTPGLGSALTSNSQSLWTLDTGASIVLEYTGSGYTSGSYSGSISNTFNEYATLKFITNNASASVYLPFFNEEWWSVAVTKEGNDFNLFAGCNIYDGNDGNILSYTGSATLNTDETEWITGVTSTFSETFSTYNKFSGSYQEIRYYTIPLSESVFYDYIMNPYSIEGNSFNSSPEQLAFRATLGGELYTASISMHPKVTGSWIPTSSFAGGNNNFTIDTGEFVINRSYIFFDQIPAGIKNIVSDKVRQENIVLPFSSSIANIPTNTVLTPFISVQQEVYPSSSYVEDINYIEVAFSPQNEINENINSQIGYFNIGELIGDPRLVSSSAESYPALDAVRDSYFEEYTHNYDIWDYIRLINYYDNALFKMVEDYVPARSSLSAGVVIKQHILERNKYPVPQVNTTSSLAIVGNDVFTYYDLDYVSQDIYNANYTYTVQSSAPYNVNFVISGSLYNETGDDPTEFEIVYVPLSGPNVILYNEYVPLGDTVNFNINFLPVNPGDQIVFTALGYQDLDGHYLEATITAASVTSSYDYSYDTENLLITGSPIPMYEITGSAGGVMPSLLVSTIPYESSSAYTDYSYPGVVNITQSWTGSTPSLSGSVSFTDATSAEFYNGEFSGSIIEVTNGELNPECDPIKSANTVTVLYDLSGSAYSGIGNFNTAMSYQMNDGELNIWFAPSASYYYGEGLGEFVNDVKYFISAFAIAKESLNGLNLENYLPQITDLVINGNYAATDFTLSGWSGATYKTWNGNKNPPLVITTFQERTSISGDQYYVFQCIPNQSSYFRVEQTDAGGPFTIGNVSVASKSSILTVLEPFVDQSFPQSDCNAIYGNVLVNRTSSVYFDVDYSSNAIVAVNEETILDETALKAEVQDSNYTMLRQINPRYLGSKNTTPLGSDLYPFNILGDSTLPAVEQLTSYFAYTPGGLGGTLAERSGSGNYKIGFLVDQTGRVIQPNVSSSDYIPNFFNTFPALSTVILSPTNDTTLIETEFTVNKPGGVYKPVLYSDTGSQVPGYLVSGTLADIDFQFNPNVNTNYNFVADRNLDYYISNTGTPSTVIWNSISSDAAGGWDSSLNRYIVPFSSPINLTVTAFIRFTIISGGAGPVTIELRRNGSVVDTGLTYTSTGTYTVTVSTSAYQAIAGDYYSVTLTNSTAGIVTIIDSPFTKFNINALSPITGITSPYFTTGSQSATAVTFLTGSANLKTMYGGSYIQFVDPNTTGFDNNLPFEIQQYDEFRFDGNESKSALISTASIVGSNLIIQLTEPLDTTDIDINYFLIRRFVPSIDNLTINSPGTLVGPGFIFPKYQSDLMKRNLPNIIQDLTSKGLISTT